MMKYNSGMNYKPNQKKNDRIIDKNQIISITSGILVFFLSLYLLPLYTDGDQTYYRRFWQALANTNDSNLPDLLDLSFDYIGSREPLYPIISKAASYFIEKDLFISIINAALAYVTSQYLCRLNVNPLLILITLTTNFYFLGFYLSAERLKFGMIFLILSCICSKKFVLVFRLMSILAHMQIASIYAICLFQKAWYSIADIVESGEIKLFVLTKRNLFVSLISSLVVLSSVIFIPILLTHSAGKLNSYSKSFGTMEYLRTLMFYLGTVIVARQYFRYLMLFLPLLVMVTVIGGDRLNFVGYLIFTDTAFRVRNGINIPSLLVAAYFTWAGFGFIQRVILYGDGWSAI